MYRSILLPLDLEATGDAALPVATALAVKHSLPLELVTVSSPGMSEMGDRMQLEQRARLSGGQCTTRVLHDNDAAEAILALAENRPDALVVMASRARGPLGRAMFGSVSEEVLGRIEQPLLVVGPRVVDEDVSPTPTLVIGVGDEPVGDIVVPAVRSWQETFGGPEPWLVEVRPPGKDAADDDLEPPDCLQSIVAAFALEGIKAEWSIVRAKRPADGLMQFADRVTDAVLVVASSRWTDSGGAHFSSTAQHAVQRAHHPVLVLPSSRDSSARR